MTPNILAKSRRARGQPRIPRLSRAGVPGGRLGAPRRDHPSRHDHAPRRLALACGARGVHTAPRRRDRPVCHGSRGERPGIPRYYATTMPFRRSAYGLIVESHEGRPTKIEGNPAHPATLGASSARIQASVLGLYDADRSQTVRLKEEPKSWSDFVTAWAELSKAHAADGGAGLAVLSESFSSPTLARLASEFRARYPKATWATYEAVSDENRLAGLRSATGRDVDLMLRFDQASVILALDADPLLTDPEMIRHARGFAAGRRAGASGGAMNRLYAVEGVFSLTGAMADHRLRLESRQIAPFLAALAARLGAAGAASQAGAGLPGVDPRWIDRACQGPSGKPRQGIDRGWGTPARSRPRRGLRPEHISRQHRQDGQLLRDEGCGASERELAGLARLRDECGHGPDARHPGRQSGVRCPRRSRLRVGHGESPSLDRARALGRRNILQGGVARPPRALPRIVGRRARGWRHGQRRPAADPSPVRRTNRRRSAGADGRRQGSSGLRHRAGHLETDPGRGRVRQEVEPRLA